MKQLAVRGALLGLAVAAALAGCEASTGEDDTGLSTGGTATGGAGGGLPTLGGAGGAGGSAGSTAGAMAAGGATGGGLGVGGAIAPPPDSGTGDGDTGPCENLECQKPSCTNGNCMQPPCAAGVVTTITGVVREPAGKIPLYNVTVYIPNAEVPPITTGATCERCDASVMNPVAAAITDTQGRFVLNDVPVGANIPLVIQVGKWRRQVMLPTVNACVENPIADPELTRLPRNQMEGNIPLIAMTTGGLDSMECLLRRMGIADTEFSTETGTGRIHLYYGEDLNAGNTQYISTKAFDTTLNGGAMLSPAEDFWATEESLNRYDMVILSCEGATFEQQKPMSARQAMYGYASGGGRVFASHWHHIWFSEGPDPLPTIGDWDDRSDPDDPTTGFINQTFPKGAALAEWLVNVNASTTLGQLEIIEARDNIQAITSTEATSWITVTNSNEDDTEAVEYLSANTPLGVPEDQKCGRMVFTDLHVSATGADMPGSPFPTSCEQRDLTAQEKAVMFMLFDLSSCIMDDDEPPEPPVVE